MEEDNGIFNLKERFNNNQLNLLKTMRYHKNPLTTFILVIFFGFYMKIVSHSKKQNLNNKILFKKLSPQNV